MYGRRRAPELIMPHRGRTRGLLAVTNCGHWRSGSPSHSPEKRVDGHAHIPTSHHFERLASRHGGVGLDRGLSR